MRIRDAKFMMHDLLFLWPPQVQMISQPGPPGPVGPPGPPGLQGFKVSDSLPHTINYRAQFLCPERDLHAGGPYIWIKGTPWNAWPKSWCLKNSVFVFLREAAS